MTVRLVEASTGGLIDCFMCFLTHDLPTTHLTHPTLKIKKRELYRSDITHAVLVTVVHAFVHVLVVLALVLAHTDLRVLLAVALVLRLLWFLLGLLAVLRVLLLVLRQLAGVLGFRLLVLSRVTVLLLLGQRLPLLANNLRDLGQREACIREKVLGKMLCTLGLRSWRNSR